jgi:Zn-dependent protease
MSSSQWLPPQHAQPAPAPEPAQAPPPPPADQPVWKRLGGIVVALGVLALKFGKVAFIAVKGAKFLTTSASMLVSVAAYSLIWGWKFALGFVLLLFVHEMGHVIQLRREGVPISGMLFIPFLGAAVGTRSLGGSAIAEARVGLAGPILGSIGAAVVMIAGFATDSEFLQALAFTAFFLNLFNLLPVVPFDGGRAMAAMAPWMWFVGLGAMAVFLFTHPNPVLILFLLLGAYEVYRRWKTRKSGEEGNPDYYDVPTAQRVLVGAVYVALLVLLVLGMDATHIARDFDDV